jgi:hypothetical protein
MHCSDLSYVDPIIPPPLHACVKSNVLSEDLLYSARNFMLSGEPDSRYIMSDKYDSLILEAEDIALLNTYSRQLTTLHQSQIRVRSQKRCSTG